MNGSAGYVDLQVNGYAGVDFNREELTAEDLHRACEAMARAGVAAMLPTVISDHIHPMTRRLARLVELREADPLARRMTPGLHIEGPFLNETDGYRGAHPLDAMQPASPDAMNRLLDAAGGLAKIVTLAPERDPDLAVTRMLADQGIVVAAGHCDPSPDELDAAIDAGLSMFTHLGNGCPMQMHRHDNIVQRVLSRSDRLRVSFIADGVHVPFFALGNYLRAAGIDRCVVVTDAMSAAGLGPGRHKLGRWEVQVGDDLAAWAPDRSHLVGSAMTITQAADNLRDHLGLPEEEIDRLLRTNPRSLLELD